MNLKKLIREELLKEYVDRNMVSLRDYFRQTEEQKKARLPEMYHEFFDEFLEEMRIDYEKPRNQFYDAEGNLQDEDEEMWSYELVEVVEREEPELFEMFANYLYKRVTHFDLLIPDQDYPAWSYFDDDPQLIKNQWLIHFTDNADSVASEGFTKGVGEIDKLGLTCHLSDFDKMDGGFNFAYHLGSYYRYGNKGWGKFKYGSEAVIFRASGMELHHRGDLEPQVIFYGETARDIIPITSGDEEDWAIHSHDGRVLYENEDLRKVVDWLTNNFNQYRRHIV